MNGERLQIAVWILMPILGLLLLVAAIGLRTGWVIIPPIIAIVGFIIFVAWWVNRENA